MYRILPLASSRDGIVWVTELRRTQRPSTIECPARVNRPASTRQEPKPTEDDLPGPAKRLILGVRWQPKHGHPFLSAAAQADNASKQRQSRTNLERPKSTTNAGTGTNAKFTLESLAVTGYVGSAGRANLPDDFDPRWDDSRDRDDESLELSRGSRAAVILSNRVIVILEMCSTTTLFPSRPRRELVRVHEHSYELRGSEAATSPGSGVPCGPGARPPGLPRMAR